MSKKMAKRKTQRRLANRSLGVQMVGKTLWA
jgi:hypothetical protein